MFIPSHFGKLKVVYRGCEFYVVDESEKNCLISRADLSEELRGLPLARLLEYLKVGYLALNQIGNDFGLKLHIRGLGGGPLAGLAAYWITKTVCYGTAVAAAGTIVVSTGGAAGGISGAIVAASTSGATVAVATVGGAIAGAGLAGEAAIATAAAVNAAGSIPATIALVESASLSVGGFFAAIPFLP